MPSTQDAKVYLGSAACLTLLLLIVLDAVYVPYEMTDRMIVLLLTLMSSLLGLDIFRKSSSQSLDSISGGSDDAESPMEAVTDEPPVVQPVDVTELVELLEEDGPNRK